MFLWTARKCRIEVLKDFIRKKLSVSLGVCVHYIG